MKLGDQLRFKHILQNDTVSCGPACIAMLAGVSLETAAAEIDRHSNGKTDWAQMRVALRTFGLEHSGRPKRVADWAKIPAVALVACSRVASGDWHWVIFDRFDGLIYDPLAKNGPRRFDVGNVRHPISYLTVHRTKEEIGVARGAGRG